METTPNSEKYRVNYFVGALLAQGGNVWIADTKIVFSPSSAIDRAMGAKDVEIPFKNIRGVSYSGALSRSFIIKAEDKVHKFEGGQAKKFLELLEKVLPNKEVIESRKNGNAPVPAASSAAVTALPSLSCDQCHKSLYPGYMFCPHCACRLKSACHSCHRAVDPQWAACAYCGWKFSSAA